MERTVDVTLLGRPGCHLCDDARTDIAAVVDSLAADPAAPTVTVTERSILDDPQLMERYAEEIPVVLIDGRMHTYWRVDRVRLAAALRDAGRVIA